MRKTLKITGIVIGSLLVLIILAAILVPVLFKGPLVAKAKEIVNENIDAKVDFKDVDISIFKNFPDITVSLNNISVVGIGEFQKDTLASISSFSASINIMSYIKRSEIDVKSVSIKEPNIHALVLKNGKVNWDIAKTDTIKVEVKEETDTTKSDFNMSLEKFEIINGTVMYHDIANSTLIGLGDFNFKMKGNLSSEKTVLDINTSVGKTYFNRGAIGLSNIALGMNTKIDADLKNMVFTLQDNQTTIGPIAFQVNGSAKMIGEKKEDIDIDITYAANIKSLDDLVKMIGDNANQISYLKNTQTRGALAFNGWIKGVYNEKSMPQIWTELSLSDGYFKFAQLPESVNNLNIDMKALFDLNHDEKTAIDVNRFHFELAGNPFDVTANVRTPMTDANIKATAKGKINFASLANAVPMKGINLAGILTADVKFAGNMSALEKEQYDRLNLSGHANLQNLIVKSKDIPMEVQITNTDFEFSPRYVEMKSFNGKMGKSDLQMQGRLENFLNYALKGELLKGNLQVASHLVDCNEIMSGKSESEKTEAEASQMSVIVLPGDIDFTMNVKVDKILYDKLTLNNATGNVVLRNGELLINNLSTGFAGGTMALTGKYKADDPSKAITGLNMDLKNVEIASVLSSFDMFDKVLPILSAFSGKISLDFNFATDLDGKMSPVLKTLTAIGSIAGDDLKITETENFNKITSLVGLNNVPKVLKAVKANFSVKDGKVQITPFPVTIGGMNMMISGQQGLDQIADFQIDIAVPAAQLAGKANDLMKQMGLPGTTANTVNVGIAVGGTITSPSFKLVTPKYMDNKGIAQQATDQVKNMVQDKAEDLLNSLTGGNKTSPADSTAKKPTTEEKVVNEAVNQLKGLLKKK